MAETENKIQTTSASKLVIVTPELAKAHPELLPYYDETLFDSKGKPLVPNAELVASIRDQGILQQVTVQAVRIEGIDKPFPIVVMGRERTRAALALESEGWVSPEGGLAKSGVAGGVPVVLRQFSAEEAALARVTENTNRKKYSWLQMARAANYLAVGLKLSQKKVGQALGMTDANVNIMLSILNKTTPDVLKAINSGLLGPTAAYNYTKKEYKDESGNPDKTKINEQLKADLSEAKEKGGKVTVSTAGTSGRTNNKRQQALPTSHYKHYAAAANTPRNISLFLRWSTGELSLGEVHKIGDNDGIDMHWLQPVVLTKESKKAARKAAAADKSTAKAIETRKVSAATDDDLSQLFPE